MLDYLQGNCSETSAFRFIFTFLWIVISCLRRFNRQINRTFAMVVLRAPRGTEALDPLRIHGIHLFSDCYLAVVFYFDGENQNLVARE